MSRVSGSIEIVSRSSAETLPEKFDTIVMNPPFGTNNAGIDMKLLALAVKSLKPGGQLFSLHKLKLGKPEMTKNFITKFVAENCPGNTLEFLFDFEFSLPNTYKHHKKKEASTPVTILRILRENEEKVEVCEKESV